jgi:hypothetical protein
VCASTRQRRGSGSGGTDDEKAAGGVRLAQFNKDAVQRVGLVKLDLLSNRALSTLAEARSHLQALAPEQVLGQAEDGDPATLELLRRADPLGIGQIETPGTRQALGLTAPATDCKRPDPEAAAAAPRRRRSRPAPVAPRTPQRPAERGDG